MYRVFLVVFMLLLLVASVRAEDASPAAPSVIATENLSVVITIAPEDEWVADIDFLLSTLEDELTITNDRVATLQSRVEGLELFVAAFTQYCELKPDEGICVALGGVVPSEE